MRKSGHRQQSWFAVLPVSGDPVADPSSVRPRSITAIPVRKQSQTPFAFQVRAWLACASIAVMKWITFQRAPTYSLESDDVKRLHSVSSYQPGGRTQDERRCPNFRRDRQTSFPAQCNRRDGCFRLALGEAAEQAERRVDDLRRSRIRRSRVLRLESPDSKPRPHGHRRCALHKPQFRSSHLLGVSCRLVDRPLRASKPHIGRLYAQLSQRHGPAAADPRQSISERRLSHAGDREVASRRRSGLRSYIAGIRSLLRRHGQRRHAAIAALRRRPYLRT